MKIRTQLIISTVIFGLVLLIIAVSAVTITCPGSKRSQLPLNRIPPLS
jgi:hypothetical protein